MQGLTQWMLLNVVFSEQNLIVRVTNTRIHNPSLKNEDSLFRVS